MMYANNKNPEHYFLGKSVKEIESKICAYNLPYDLLGYEDEDGNTICYVLLDKRAESDAVAYDCYFGGFGEGHFNLGLSDLIMI